jgi:hypothetical protein
MTILVIGVRNLPKIYIIKITNNFSKYSISIILLVLIVIFFTKKYGLPNISIFALSDVYDVRFNNKGKFSVFWQDILPIFNFGINPFIFSVSLEEKNRKLTLISALTAIYFFFQLGTKTTLLSIFFMYLMYMLYNKKNVPQGLGMTLSFIIVISDIINKYFNNVSFLALFGFRLFAVPANLSFMHYDFFSTNEKLYFSETVFGKIFNLKSPYNVHSTYLIGSGLSNANTGFLADAYDQGGFIVMIIYTLLLIFIFLLVKTVSKNHPLTVFVCFSYFIITLNDSSLLTAISTFGGGILLLLLYRFYSFKNEKEIRN